MYGANKLYIRKKKNPSSCRNARGTHKSPRVTTRGPDKDDGRTHKTKSNGGNQVMPVQTHTHTPAGPFDPRKRKAYLAVTPIQREDGVVCTVR